MLTVYLAGPVRGPDALWRWSFAAAAFGLCDAGDLLLISPGGNMPGAVSREEAEGATGIYVPADILSLRRADALVSYLKADESGRGTGFEMGYALAEGTPIYAIAETAGDRESWGFALGNLGSVYPGIAEAALAVAYAARQLAGKSAYDPKKGG